MPLDGTLFVLALHGTTPVCEAWTATPAALTHGDMSVGYRVDGDQLVLDGVQHGDATSTCSERHHLAERGDGFDVDGAHLFRTKAACQAAIAKHARVVMQWPCDPLADFPDPIPATRRRFDDVLAYGAIMYAEGACNRMRFEATKLTATSVEGELSYRVPGGLEAYTYEATRGSDRLILLGPGGTNDDGSSWGIGCMDEVALDYATDHVSVMGNLYFDKASCQAATAREAYRQSWLPGDAEARTQRLPIAGGC